MVDYSQDHSRIAIPANGEELHFAEAYKGKPIRLCLSYQVQSKASIHPDVLPAYITSLLHMIKHFRFSLVKQTCLGE